MPYGGFLDSLPTALFVIVHIILFGVGVWAALKVRPIFWLYAITQLIFLAFFGKWFTIKLAVLLEQILLVIMVIWIIVKSKKTS